MVQLCGREIDATRLERITVRALGVDLAGLSAAALVELYRNFTATARKFRYSLRPVKRGVRHGCVQIEKQLSAEAERRRGPEPRPSAATLTLLFESVEGAGFFVAFLAGLEEMYIAARAETPRQGEMERSICDVKAAGYECAKFCSSVAMAITETEVEI